VVIGEKDEILGETIIAYLVLRQDHVVDEKEVLKYCKRNLPAFKTPHRITILDELPKSNSGKIQKNLFLNP
jgi:long-chain acyl-CoA synthetase